MYVGNVIFKSLLAPVARTATANGTGVDLGGLVNGKALKVMVEVGAASGTTPTLDVKIQESDDNSTFTDIAGATATQLTAVGSSSFSFITNKRYVRAVATIAGTTPSFTCAAYLIGTAKAG